MQQTSHGLNGGSLLILVFDRPRAYEAFRQYSGQCCPQASGNLSLVPWYTAHLVTYFRFVEGPQDYFPVQENLVLIEAANGDEAMAKARAKGLDYEGDSGGSLRCDDRAARQVFAGVRRLIECVDPEQRPGDGTEVSYHGMIVTTEADLQRLAAGEEVSAVTLSD